MTEEPEVDEFTPRELSEMQVDTLSGDLRDLMLTRFRASTKPWSMMAESEQYDLANGLECAAKDLIRHTVSLITAHDFPHAVVKLSDIKIIGGDKSRIDIKCEASNISINRDVLGDYVNDMVQIVAINSERFMGERAPVSLDADQPDLPMDGAGDEPAPKILASDDFEALLSKAKAFISDAGSVSPQNLQIHLGVGPAQVAAVLESLEKMGFVSPPDHIGNRSATFPDE